MERKIKFEVRYDDTKEIIGYERIGGRGHWEHNRVNRKDWLLGSITDGQEYSKFIRRQFTGLQDKNGVDIFEGDKIHIWGGTEFNGMFEYDYRGICEFMGAEFCVNSKNCCIGFGELEYREVVGNIYD